MELISPAGEKHIIVQSHESIHITLQDFTPGSRQFRLVVELAGERSKCSIHGRAITQNTDEKHWTIEQIITGTDCVSRLDVRGVATDESLLVFDGRAVLERVSRNADAEISEKILLTGSARGKSLPVLTVRTDQVQSASHGATVAPVSSESLLYCMSRGLTKTAAEALLQQGFLR